MERESRSAAGGAVQQAINPALGPRDQRRQAAGGWILQAVYLGTTGQGVDVDTPSGPPVVVYLQAMGSVCADFDATQGGH